jgi:hypothetical protein
MTVLPRVAQSTREQIAREFDDAGPDQCIADISAHLREHNPEWLYMAAKCASDVGNPQRIMRGFCMFYRLLIAQASPDHKLTMVPGAPATLNPLPRITTATRAAIVAAIDKNSTDIFICDAICELEKGNPELLQMADYFASASDNYLGVMQGFALLYTALLIQSGTDSLSMH